ncbi:hypothetical protein DV515_00017167 [Chloebia gouldiae]|uniref:Uncharacterized protein n=1 Tax=Chloebia gouldiae TaxID=44316 RepID=A0A3L8R0T4_CHLGU|nr:hypothetical protein DV515_00017170 [Chloebia gouldiae]RLV73188.1 hypothetical protein DV515_00017167 [Chloebia gouldiae]
MRRYRIAEQELSPARGTIFFLPALCVALLGAAGPQLDVPVSLRVGMGRGWHQQQHSRRDLESPGVLLSPSPVWERRRLRGYFTGCLKAGAEALRAALPCGPCPVRTHRGSRSRLQAPAQPGRVKRSPAGLSPPGARGAAAVAADRRARPQLCAHRVWMSGDP